MKILPKHIFREKHFGLSITHSSIRAMAVSQKKEIISSAEVSLEPNVFTYENIHIEKLSASLKQLLQSGQFTSKYAAVCIPEYHSFTRTHTIPRIPLEDITEALSWQIEDIFPLPKSEIYYDWKLLEEKDGKLELLVVAMPKKTLDDLIQVFESVGIKPISFEPSASALTRLLELKTDQPTILIEVNPSGSSATLIEKKISTLTITNQFEQGQAGIDIKQALQKTSQSVQSLIIFHSNRNNSETRDVQLLLSGDSASTELSQWLSTYLNKEVKLLEIPNVQQHYQQAFAATNTSVNTPDSGLSVNLLPTQLQQIYDAGRVHQKVSLRLKVSLALSIFALIISSCAYFGVSMLAQRKQSELLTLQSNVQLNYDAQEVSSLNKTSSAIVRLFATKQTPVDIWEELLALKPENILYTKILYEKDKNKVIIIGNAVTREDLQLLNELIDKSDTFKTPNLPITSFEQAFDINFSLEVGIQKPNG